MLNILNYLDRVLARELRQVNVNGSDQIVIRANHVIIELQLAVLNAFFRHYLEQFSPLPSLMSAPLSYRVSGRTTAEGLVPKSSKSKVFGFTQSRRLVHL